jgi:hypothetical protein
VIRTNSATSSRIPSIDHVYLAHPVSGFDDAHLVFEAYYGRAVGPLPNLKYRLVGLWRHDDVVLKAIFEAPHVPVQHGEPILHRYESNMTVQQGQANYRYIVIPGYAGMVLKRLPYAYANAWLRMSLDENRRDMEAWTATQTPERLETLVFEQIEDVLGHFDPILVCLKPQVQEEF